MNYKNKNNQGFWNFLSTVIYLSIVSVSVIILDRNGRLSHDVPTFDFIVMSLAVFRLIRLFTYDSVTSYIRDYFGKFEEGPGKTIRNLINCPWCTGVWMALIVFVLYFSNPLFWYLLLILALAGIGSFIQITIWKIGRES